MAYRTKLTCPPGEEPETAAPRRRDEWWSPGLELPVEPRPPSRWRGIAVMIVLILLGIGLALVTFRVLTAGQAEDPSLEISFIDRGEP